MPRLRESRLEDGPQIARLGAAHGLAFRPEPLWSRTWTENPAMRTGWPMGWVLEDDDGAVVGHFGNIPMRYELEGRLLQVGVGADWVVAEGQGFAALQMLRRFFRQPDVDMLLCTSANAAAAKAYVAFHARRIPSPGYDRTLFWITSPRGFITALAKKREKTLPPGIARVAGLPLAARERLVRSRPPSGVSLAVCGEVPADVRTIWERVSGDGVLRFERTPAQLAWHYGPALADGRAWVVVARRGAARVRAVRASGQPGDRTHPQPAGGSAGRRRPRVADRSARGRRTGRVRAS